MKYTDVQKKSDKELKKALAANSENMRKFRFDATGAAGSTDTSSVKNMRRDNARILTELNVRAKQA